MQLALFWSGRPNLRDDFQIVGLPEQCPYLGGINEKFLL